MTNFTVLINELSGGVIKYGREKLEADLKQALINKLDSLIFLEPDAFLDELQRYAKSDFDTNIIIGGGDGTILTAAKIFKKHQKPFGILPLGTMNSVARNLGMNLDPAQAASDYKKSKVKTIDIVKVNDDFFLCGAMFGLPIALAEEREAIREAETLSKWASFAGRIIDKISDDDEKEIYSIRHDGTEGFVEISAGVISNNLYDEHVHIGSPLQTKSLEDGQMGIYMINPQGYVEGLRLLASLLAGVWDKQQGLNMLATKKIEINTNKSHMDILLDGEYHKLELPVIFEIEPKSLPLLVPCNA